MKNWSKVLLTLFFTLFLQHAMAAEEQAYKVSPDDVLTINVFGEPELSFPSIRISADGTIPFQLIGDVRVVGLTTSEVESAIANKLSEGFLKSPKVSVFVKEYREVFIYGQVQRPGAYNYQKGMTIERIIALASGLTARAAKSKITFLREDSPGAKKAELSTRLRPGDVVTIGESYF